MLVTGAARGIGEAIACAFVHEGARVYLSDINDALGVAVAARLGGGMLRIFTWMFAGSRTGCQPPIAFLMPTAALMLSSTTRESPVLRRGI